MDTLDIDLRCDICGTNYTAQGINPAVNEGILRTWKELHTHSEAEIKLYLATELESQKSMHEHWRNDYDE